MSAGVGLMLTGLVVAAIAVIFLWLSARMKFQIDRERLQNSALGWLTIAFVLLLIGIWTAVLS